MIYCFFEQSGTFKNEFLKLGYKAVDIDILNDFNQTDLQCDLFNEIELCFDSKTSLFDSITSNDLIFAFFPCVRFTDMILLQLSGSAPQCKNRSLETNLINNISLINETSYFYSILCKLFIICLRRNIKLIVENPYSTQHFLINRLPFKPTVIDTNRRLNGDYYSKPTQYYFLNFVPRDNFFLESLNLPDKLSVNCQSKVNRSLISSTYANRFIRIYLEGSI